VQVEERVGHVIAHQRLGVVERRDKRTYDVVSSPSRAELASSKKLKRKRSNAGEATRNSLIRGGSVSAERPSAKEGTASTKGSACKTRRFPDASPGIARS
jgi:hypothetical protein